MAPGYRVPRIKLFSYDVQDDPAMGTPPADELVDWSRVRRVRPLDQLLPATSEWARRLPEAIRPVHLVRLYPRVANRLAFAWQDRRATEDVFDDVLIDRRGGRRGFPPDVRADLLQLRAHMNGGHTLVTRERRAIA